MIIKREHVRLEPAGSSLPQLARAPSGARAGGPASARAAVAGAHGRATLRAIELGGEVRGFELVCGCGEVHAVELVFDEGESAPAAAHVGKGAA